MHPSFTLGQSAARSIVVLAALGFGLGLAPGSRTVGAARAEPIGLHQAGPMLGLSSGPDQFIFGGIAELGEIAQNFHLVGSADIGFGDNFTVFTMGPSMLYDIPIEDSGAFFFGGQLALAYTNFSFRGRNASNTDLGIAGELGYKVAAGENTLIFDIKVGIIDYPDAKFLVGYAFDL